MWATRATQISSWTIWCLLASGLPAMAQGLGAIGGIVTDGSGGVLPGVTVRLASADGGTVGGTQEQVTSDRGTYEFVGLVSGRYHVRAELSGFRTTEQAWDEMVQVGPWDGERPTMRGLEPSDDADDRPTPQRAEDELVLASWKQMVDDGRMQEGEEAYLATARKPVLLVGAATLERLGVAVGDSVTLEGPLGTLQLPVGVADLAEGTVWAPASAPGAPVRRLVGPAGSVVTVTGGVR